MLERLTLSCVLWLAACDDAAMPKLPTARVTEHATPAAADATAAPATTAPATTTRAASAAATRLAAYEQRETGVPARAVAAGVALAIDDVTLRFDRPALAEPETRLPWIASSDERAVFRGKQALIVPFAVRNDAPVARVLDVGFVLHTRDGKRHTGGVYNERLAATQRGRVSPFDLGRLAPDTWVESVLVFDVEPAELAGAVLYVSHRRTVRDRFDRRRRVVAEHVVVDLAEAEAAAPIRAR